MEPLNATGLFSVSPSLDVHQTIIFDYFDEERLYFNMADDIEAYEDELETLARNMQYFLDKEEVVINDERVRPKVIGVHIGFREAPEDVVVTYFIYFRGRPREGVNYYENIYEEEVAEYPIAAYWYFHPSIEILDVEASGDVEIIGPNILAMHLAEGDHISGYEKITFKIPRKGF